MPRLRIESSSVKERRAARFGVLLVKSLLQKADLKQISVLHIGLEGGARAPAMYHRKTHEFFFVLKGRVHGHINGKKCLFGPGDFCFLPAGVVHQFHAGRSGAQTLDIFSPRLDLKNPDIVLV